MITPIEFVIEDFLSPSEDERMFNSFKAEALTGSELIDSLLLLKVCDLSQVQKVLAEKYSLDFAWLNMDMTPPEFKQIAEKHKVLIEKGRSLVVYVPLGQAVDDSLLQVDIPNYELHIRFIADCNFNLLKSGLSSDLLSYRVAKFRPLLVFRVLMLDCISQAGTDVHLESFYNGKTPAFRIRNKIIGKLKPSIFQIDGEMIKSITYTVVDKLTSSSASVVDAEGGLTTGVHDLFFDGSCDVRFTCVKCSAGLYTELGIQTTVTTDKRIEDLGFPKEDVAVIRDLAKRRTGLTLVTGKMRTGKNTTIFAMLNEIKDDPIQIMEYSNPIENRMSFQQIDYAGDISRLKDLLKLAKKQDLDIAVLNEIPNDEVAFAVRDLVNSAIGVITTTHIDRLWHLPNKLSEFFGKDYKTIISQINAVINHKMFRRWSGPNMQKRALVKEQGPFEMFCYRYGVRQYFVPEDIRKVKYTLQPLTEILVFTDSMKNAILNFDEITKGEQMLLSQLEQRHGRIEEKVAYLINEGSMSLDEMREIYN